MGKDLDEIKELLLTEPAYTRFSHHYDLIYDRFQQSTDFLDLVKKSVRSELSILDLAGKIGES